jgi:predicted XRE-type DNA-binding protein
MVEYKELKEYPGYRVGSDGTVWSYKFKSGTKTQRWKELKPWNAQGKNNSQPYKMIGLNVAGVRKYRTVHQLVLEAFVGGRPKGMVACHNNDIGIDNRLENLRWDTVKNNIKDRTEKGTHLKNTLRGSGHPNSKINEKQARKIKKLLQENKHTQKEIANKCGVKESLVSDINKKRAWRHINV